MRALLLALVLIGSQAPAGRVLSGRVLGKDGKPLPEARVVLLAPAGGRDEPRKLLLETKSGADGRFELRDAPQTRAELFVRGECAGVRLVALDAGQGAHAFGDVALVGPGELSGRATFVDGHPAPDIELWAVPEEVALQPNALVLCVEQALEHELGGRGLFSTRARTDAEGRFRLAGLCEGRYMLRCPRAAVVLEPRSGYYQATTENIALAVESARLRVRALDPAGRELAGVRVRLVELNEAGGGRYQPGQVWNETTGGPLACASFDVQPESAYGLRVEAKGFAVQEDLVLLSQNEYEQVHEYRLEPPREPGRVRLVLHGQPGLAPGEARVDLVSPLYGAPDPEADPLKLDAQGWLPPLAPGRYFFAVHFLDAPAAPNWYLPLETKELLELAPKAEKEVSVPLAAGGRFELALTGAALAQVELRVEGLEGQPKATLRFAERAEGPALGLDLLPPGNYRIHAAAPRCRDIEAQVRLEAGKFTRLELELKPR